MVRSRSRPSSPPFCSLSLSPSRLKPSSPTSSISHSVAAAASANTTATKQQILPSAETRAPPDPRSCATVRLDPARSDHHSPSDELSPASANEDVNRKAGKQVEERCCGGQRKASDSPSCSASSAIVSGGGGAGSGDSKRMPALPAALCCGRQRLERHWMEVAGTVSIPESWGREHHLQDWVRFGIVEDALAPVGLMTARSALVSECQIRRASSAISNRTCTSPPYPTKAAPLR